MSEAQTFGERVRVAREARGWSQAHLARIAQVDRSTINRIETGETEQVFLSNARRIAQALQISLDSLAEAFGTEDEPSEVVLVGGCGCRSLDPLRAGLSP